VVLINKI